MCTISSVQLDKGRPALVLTRQSKLHLLTWVTVAPIASTVRGIISEVPVGPRHGLDQNSVVSCGHITTVRRHDVGPIETGAVNNAARGFYAAAGYAEEEVVLSRALSSTLTGLGALLPRRSEDLTGVMQPGRALASALMGNGYTARRRIPCGTGQSRNGTGAAVGRPSN